MRWDSWFTAVSICAVLTTGPVLAQDVEHDRCMEASRGVTVEMLDCIGAAYERANDALHALLAGKSARVEEEMRAVFQNAHDHWIAYRDTTCDAEAFGWGDGSFAAVALADCRLRITRERLNWLEKIQFSENPDDWEP